MANMLEGTLEGSENVLKLEQTDRCTILQIYQVTELYTYNEGILWHENYYRNPRVLTGDTWLKKILTNEKVER